MTARDFEVIARIIRETMPALPSPMSSNDKSWASGCSAACERIQRHIADYAAWSYPRFDRERFEAACREAPK